MSCRNLAPTTQSICTSHPPQIKKNPKRHENCPKTARYGKRNFLDLPRSSSIFPRSFLDLKIRTMSLEGGDRHDTPTAKSGTLWGARPAAITRLEWGRAEGAEKASCGETVQRVFFGESVSSLVPLRFSDVVRAQT